MFVIDKDNTIHLTRGDIATIEIRTTKDGEEYIFTTGDVVRLKVVEKKNYSNVVLQKDVVINGETTVVDMFLDNNDTTIGDVINKPKGYWYEVELNPDTAPQTIIGHDEYGAKVFKLYPEGSDVDA